MKASCDAVTIFDVACASNGCKARAAVATWEGYVVFMGWAAVVSYDSGFGVIPAVRKEIYYCPEHHPGGEAAVQVQMSATHIFGLIANRCQQGNPDSPKIIAELKRMAFEETQAPATAPRDN